MSRHNPYYDTPYTTDDLRRPLRFTNNAISNSPSMGSASAQSYNTMHHRHDAAPHDQSIPAQNPPDHLLAENMLRRKTPSGTLNNAYHASMQDLNPTKHVILPHQSGQFPYPGTYSQPQSDSALYQGSARPLHVVNPLAQGAASAIQHPGQPYGPTASGINLQGPYGPYYYDGTFAPYQPTAVRDPRFYHDGVHGWHGQGTQVFHHVSQPRFDSPLQPQTFDRHRSAPMLPANSYAYQQPTLGHHSVAPSYEHGGTDLEPFNNFTGLENSPQGREKVFNSALKAYRELLAFLEYVRKQTRQHSRPSIYPKPPSSSTGHAPSVEREAHKQVNTTDPARDRPANDSMMHSRQVGHSMHRNKDTISSNVNSDALRQLPPMSVMQNIPHHQGGASLPQRHSGEQFGHQRRSSGAMHGHSRSHVSTSSSFAKARTALSSMLYLCKQTEWQWIDGLNLSGCLAYGLSDYHLALQLYEKVLNLDGQHLEATSNLAATLLALDRRSEAERNWMKVVRQAPNHFEAVEHLVGLLCTSSRNKDAIRIIDYVERSLRIEKERLSDQHSEVSSSISKSPCLSEISDRIHFDYELQNDHVKFADRSDSASTEPGFSSSGFAIPGCDNGDNAGAAKSFEDAVLIATGRKYKSVKELITQILEMISAVGAGGSSVDHSTDPILLHPDQAVQTASLCFPHRGDLPGLHWMSADSQSFTRKSAIMTTSNSLLSLAKIFQDGMSTSSHASESGSMVSGVREILALYYLSLSLQPSPSTANNVGILLAGVQQSAPVAPSIRRNQYTEHRIPGVIPGSGIALALAYYNYGLVLDQRHAHLHTNLGSLLKDIGQLDAAIEMYKRAVACDSKFDIALANLANAVKDKGRISEAIEYYSRAVEVNPQFAEAVCGLANALNSVCGWKSRGGVVKNGGKLDRWHVDEQGMLLDATQPGAQGSGWIKRVVDIVEKQLTEGQDWGVGLLTPTVVEHLVRQMMVVDDDAATVEDRLQTYRKTIQGWAGGKSEGARLLRLIERMVRRIGWHWYHDKHVKKQEKALSSYNRPQLPAALTIPSAPTLLPFHTFTSPVNAQQVRLISQRNGYRLSASTLRAPWLPVQVYTPPLPPQPQLKVGYISSDFNNHPLAHLMQSVFGMHDTGRVEAFCYATTASDNSVHRQQIEAEATHFIDASNWSTEGLVQQIVKDGIHVLVNLNGYTRGARNEVFAARPAPIQMSFMGFAGTLGAEWCDYLLADETAIPQNTLRPMRRNVDLMDQMQDDNNSGADENWVYGENIIFCRDTFFCCDHKQSAPDSQEPRLSWEDEQKRRWAMRKKLFPTISEDTIIFGNFNQLYKIDPTTFRTWLRILTRVPNSILWLLRFPDLGESNLLRTARQWAGSEVASRVIFTDVAPKHMHISRARVCDLFLDTPECNAHTTAADVLWSGTPLLTLPRYDYKMCSRMAASILRGALPRAQPDRANAERDLIASSEDEYEEMAIKLGQGLKYPRDASLGRVGFGQGRLVELRKMLTDTRWTSALFDTRRWVSDLEDAYDEAWRRWVAGEGGDIWLDEVPRGRAPNIEVAPLAL
ncbi:hypothetical protein MBLNU457_g2609t2 [Dothideomycetes sp. NU457]